MRIVAPAGGERLVAGDLVEVRWQGLPDDVDELELLLDVGEHAEVRLRLTPQLAGSTRSSLWQVPNLPGQEARLRIRWGRAGVETEGEPSAAFTIVPDRHAPVTGVQLRCGEWWVGDATDVVETPVDVIIRVLGDRLEDTQPAVVSTIDGDATGLIAVVGVPSTAGAPRPATGRAGIKSVTARCPVEFPLRP